ncbi:MAG: PEP-CTERM sorting domain-containing protein [Verrucomicrobiota bacterium JB023]|nr:PEP-CTERM sorting domain-containing protein [Verrucomicrobiota bacterium JB023]
MRKQLVLLPLIAATAPLGAQSSITIAGSSTQPIVLTSGESASSYLVGYFESSEAPDSRTGWATFEPLAGFDSMELGTIAQSGSKTPQDGQFAFSYDVSEREQIGLTEASDYPRRLGIRFFNSSGTQWNTVSAYNSDWLVNDPEGFAPTGSVLSLQDEDLVWEFSSSPFTAVPEPSTWLFLAMGCGWIGRRRRA